MTRVGLCWYGGFSDNIGLCCIFQHLVEESQEAMDWLLGGNDDSITGCVVSSLLERGPAVSSGEFALYSGLEGNFEGGLQ